jgi:hypothetical protein
MKKAGRGSCRLPGGRACSSLHAEATLLCFDEQVSNHLAACGIEHDCPGDIAPPECNWSSARSALNEVERKVDTSSLDDEVVAARALRSLNPPRVVEVSCVVRVLVHPDESN